MPEYTKNLLLELDSLNQKSLERTNKAIQDLNNENRILIVWNK
jgi:hypothetical protein